MIMNRRDFLENIGIATTAPLAFHTGGKATDELEAEYSALGDVVNQGDSMLFRRGREGEVLIEVDKTDEVEDPRLRIINQTEYTPRYNYPLQEDAVPPHLAEEKAVVYYSDPKRMHILDYYGGSRRYNRWTSASEVEGIRD